MGLKDYKWFTDLQLSEKDFASCPEDKNPLLWALESNILTEEDYTVWASNNYLLPRVKAEFFSMAVDQSLCEKYQELYSWSEHIFPIYEWEGRIYISCLEPIEWDKEQEICQVIAPYSAMKLLWNKIQPEKVETEAIVETVAAEVEATSEEPQPPAIENLQIPEINEEPSPSPAEENSEILSATSLDFSSLGAPPPPIEDEMETKTEEEPPPPPSSEETLQSLSFQSLETVSKEAPPLPVDEGEIDDDATPLPETQVSAVIPLPTLDKKDSQDLPPEPPAVEETAAPPPQPPLAEEAIAPPVPVAESAVPKEHLVQESDLATVQDLNQCKDVHQVVLHIFSHIRNDFEKLMWLSKEKENVFQPQLVFGPWNMDEKSWQTPIDTQKPNIFRITWNSRLPFHGHISNNSINQSYFDLWNKGDVPKHMTIFPLLAGTNRCEGFIVGCGQGNSFDNHLTYKKLENLLSLSNKQLSNQSEKAS